MSLLHHIRQHRWSAAWITAAMIAVYLAFTGISSMIGKDLLPTIGQAGPVHAPETPTPEPQQMFTSALIPLTTQETLSSKLKIGPAVGKYLKESRTLAFAKRFREAMDMVRAASAVQDKTPYEEFIIREMLAYVAINLGDYATAAQAYEEILDSAFLATDQYNKRLKTLIQLYYQQKNYAQVKNFGQLYLDKIGNKTEILVLMAQADYIQKDYANAARLTSALIEQSDGEIKEDWLKLLMSCHHNLGQRDQVVSTLTQLLERYPRPSYWLDMISYLNTTPKITDRVNFEIYRLKRETVGLQDSDHIEMAEIALALGLPREAEIVLQQGFDAKLSGDANSYSRESRLLVLARRNAAEDLKSLSALDKKSRQSSAGQDSIKLGEAYLSYGKYQQAIDAINRGLNKGNFAQVGEAQLHLGIALMKLNRKEQARAAFNAVPKNSSLYKTAKLWAVHLGKT